MSLEETKNIQFALLCFYNSFSAQIDVTETLACALFKGIGAKEGVKAVLKKWYFSKCY